MNNTHKTRWNPSKFSQNILQNSILSPKLKAIKLKMKSEPHISWILSDLMLTPNHLPDEGLTKSETFWFDINWRFSQQIWFLSTALVFLLSPSSPSLPHLPFQLHSFPLLTSFLLLFILISTVSSHTASCCTDLCSITSNLARKPARICTVLQWAPTRRWSVPCVYWHIRIIWCLMSVLYSCVNSSVEFKQAREWCCSPSYSSGLQSKVEWKDAFRL